MPYVKQSWLAEAVECLVEFVDVHLFKALQGCMALQSSLGLPLHYYRSKNVTPALLDLSYNSIPSSTFPDNVRSVTWILSRYVCVSNPNMLASYLFLWAVPSSGSSRNLFWFSDIILPSSSRLTSSAPSVCDISSLQLLLQGGKYLTGDIFFSLIST